VKMLYPFAPDSPDVFIHIGRTKAIPVTLEQLLLLVLFVLLTYTYVQIKLLKLEVRKC